MTKMQKIRLAPNVREEMLNSDYWISQSDKEIVLNIDEIDRLNKASFEKAKSLGKKEEFYELSSYPERLSGLELKELMEESSDPGLLEEKVYYHQNGKKMDTKTKDEIKKRSNLDNLADEVQVRPGMLTRRANIRSFPTVKVLANQPDTVDQDMGQLTALSVGTPLFVLHESADKKWYYIQTPRYSGWVLSKKVGLAEKKEDIFFYNNADQFLVVTESRVRTEPNPFSEDISDILFQMGDKIPLVADDEMPESIPENNQQAQSPEGCYVIWLPVRDDRGRLDFKKALISRSNELSEGYLPYTRENLLTQAFKLLGERYGWGGIFSRRDCSRFVMDIYRTVGVQIPRDAGFPQEEIAAGESYFFAGDLKERKKVFDKLKPGDPIYMKGHVMVFLGKDDGRYYLIHSGSGYGREDDNGSHKPITVHGVFVMDAEQLKKTEKESYLGSFKMARRFVI